MEQIITIMEQELDKTREKLMSCKDIEQLEGLAYELIAKNEIFGAIVDELVDITDYIDILKELENPLQKIYNTFMSIIWESNRIIDDEQIYDCLDNLINKGE